MVEYPPFPMMSSCIAVFRAPSSRLMSGFIFTLWLPSSKKRIAGTDRTWVEYKRPGKPAALLRLCASPASCLVRDRVLDAHRRERIPSLAAGDARAAMDFAVPVARPGHIEGDLHVEAHADHVVLRFPAQRHEDLDGGRIVGPEAQMEDAVEEVEELRARVRERFRIDPVVATDNISDGIELGIMAREAIEDQVPTGDVPLRGIEESAVLEALLTEVVHLFQKGQVDATQRPRTDPRGEGQHGVVFAPGSPEIIERQRADVPALLLRPPQCDRRIDAARKEDDRAFHGKDRLYAPRRPACGPWPEASDPSIAGPDPPDRR